MIFQFEHLRAHLAQHGDPEPHGVGWDHVGVMVLGQRATHSCQPKWCSPLMGLLVVTSG